MSTLSPRERVQLALAHQETDYPPFSMICSGINPAARAELANYLATHRGLTIEQYIDPLIDVKYVMPDYRGPALLPNTDMWGVRRQWASYGIGAYEEVAYSPLASATTLKEIEDYRWPVTDWFDYDSIARQIAELDSDKEYCLMTMNGNIFEMMWYLRGFETAFADLAAEPEITHAIFERLTTFFIEHFTRILQAGRGRIDLVFTADDLGGQDGLLVSRKMWEENLKPYHARLNRAIHEHGARVIYHTDGAVMEVVDGLIDMGIDILEALQFDALGMDPELLKTTYGDRLSFAGGVSVQKTLPFGTVDEVRHEVHERVRVLARNGGYILGPSHYIQDGTPVDNIVAFFDTVTEMRKGAPVTAR